MLSHHKMSAKDRTKLNICVSGAANCEESAVDIRFGVALQKSIKTNKKHAFLQVFSDFGFLTFFGAPSVVRS